MSKELLQQAEITKKELVKLTEMIDDVSYLHSEWYSAFDKVLTDLEELVQDLKCDRY